MNNMDVLRREFFEAANSGSVAGLQRCLDDHHDGGVSVDVKNEQGQTALYRASLHGHVEAVRFLIQDRGANVNITTTTTTTIDDDEHSNNNQTNYSCLQSASQEGHVEVMKLLLQAGANVKHQDAHGDSALHDAIHYNNQNATAAAAAAELLLDYGADLMLPVNNQGLTPCDFCTSHDMKNHLLHYNPLNNLYKQLNASNQHVQELRQEVYMLKNLILATAFVGVGNDDNNNNNMTLPTKKTTNNDDDNVLHQHND
jgi:Ankyrin repeats (many copies)